MKSVIAIDTETEDNIPFIATTCRLVKKIDDEFIRLNTIEKKEIPLEDVPFDPEEKAVWEKAKLIKAQEEFIVRQKKLSEYFESKLYDLNVPSQKRSLIEVCGDPSVVKIFHPATYDIYGLRLAKIDVVPPYEDTLIIASYFNEYAEARALKKLAKSLLDEPCEEDKELKKLKTRYKKLAKKGGYRFSYRQIPSKVLWPYAKKDAEYTLRVWLHLKTWMDQYPDLYNLEKEIIPIVVDMETIGLRLNREYLKKACAGYHGEEARLDKLIREYLRKNVKEWSTERIQLDQLLKNKKKFKDTLTLLKVPAIEKDFLKKAFDGDHEALNGLEIQLGRYLRKNKDLWTESQIEHEKLLGSPQRLSEAMKLLNVPIQKKAPKTGNLATDKATLKTVADHEFVDLLLKYRYVKKQLSTYFDPFLNEYTSDDNDRAHFLFWQAGAQRTGRFSADRIQTIPKTNEDKGEYPARNCFIPREGYALAMFDYNQIEMRLFAALSNSEKLIAALKSGFDCHLDTAFNIFGKDVVLKNDKSKKFYRDAAKTINFGIIYGMGVEKLSLSLGLSKMDAQRALTKYYQQYPVRVFMGSNSTELSKKGFLRLSYDSPRLRFERDYRIPKNFSYKATNVKIQSTAAYIIKFAMIRVTKLIKERGWKIFLLGQIHDELIYEIPKNILTKNVLRQIKNEMEDLVTFKIPITASCKLGFKSWGEAKEFKI